MRVSPLCVAALVSALLALSACGSSETRICPSIAIPRHARIDLQPALSRAGTYQIEVEADGRTESCTLEMGQPAAARDHGGVVEGPRTTTSTTCTMISIGGISGGGHIASLEAGAPAHLRIVIRSEGSLVGEGTFQPSYTPDECGFEISSHALPIRTP